MASGLRNEKKFSRYWHAFTRAAAARNEIEIVQEALREKGLYEYSDALRTIAQSLDAHIIAPESDFDRKYYPDVTGEFQEKHCGGAPNMKLVVGGS